MKRKEREEKEKLQGEAAFNLYYSSLYGKRWTSLKAALLSGKSPLRLVHGGAEYFMDSASAFAACALPLSEESSILDMCAAPGGKALVLTKRLPASSRILLNEISSSRMLRLRQAANNLLSETEKSKVSFSLKDALSLRGESLFDAVLLDAPCSSERHVMSEAKYLAAWKEERVKLLARKQLSLIKKAAALLKENGFLLYCTCALTKAENDEVISKALLKRKELRLISSDLYEIKSEFARLFPAHSPPHFEKLEHGFISLPDTSNGAGPLYFALLRKSSL